MGWWDWVPRKVEEPKWMVCVECRVHFEPDGASQFAEYCLLHRKPKIEAKRREDQLVYWVKGHMDLVEKLKAKQDKKESAQQKKAHVDPLSGLGLNLYGDSSLAAQQNIVWNTWDSAFGRY